jgi:hypothetical protein
MNFDGVTGHAAVQRKPRKTAKVSMTTESEVIINRPRQPGKHGPPIPKSIDIGLSSSSAPKRAFLLSRHCASHLNESRGVGHSSPPTSANKT